MAERSFAKGDWVIFRRKKITTHPGPRAKEVQAAPHGDDYYYFVDKFWIVAQVMGEDKLLLQTRRGKQHIIHRDDPQLRHASLWDRIVHRRRFTSIPPPD